MFHKSAAVQKHQPRLFYRCSPHRVSPRHGKNTDLSVPNMPTWHGLVYFVRPLAQLRSSAHCAQCLPTMTGGKKPCKGQKVTVRRLTCSVRRVPRAVGAPHGRGGAPLLPGAEWSDAPAALAAKMNEERLRPHAHTHIRLLLLTWKTSLRQSERLPASTQREAFFEEQFRRKCMLYSLNAFH